MARRIVACLVALAAIGCTPPDPIPAPSEPKLKFQENSFLRTTSTAQEEVVEVDFKKIVSVPGSKRSFIMLNMQEIPNEETMRTILLVIRAFEKKCNVTVIPGGWQLMWQPDTPNRNSYIFGVALDHDQPIDLSYPERIRLDDILEAENPRLEPTPEKTAAQK